jgi:hypothetical protein
MKILTDMTYPLASVASSDRRPARVTQDLKLRAHRDPRWIELLGLPRASNRHRRVVAALPLLLVPWLESQLRKCPQTAERDVVLARTVPAAYGLQLLDAELLRRVGRGHLSQLVLLWPLIFRELLLR